MPEESQNKQLRLIHRPSREETGDLEAILNSAHGA